LSRTERLLELINLVKAQTGRFTVQEMAERFGISRRTMLRDLQALSAMGVPLAASPGPGGGYSLAYPHRPISLSLFADEALGLILSYEAVLQDAPSPFRQASVSAITKLRCALSPEVVRDLDRLRERVAVVGVERTYEAPLLQELLQAAIDRRHLRVKYDSRQRASERLIFPYGLVAALGFWYCACYDYRRNAHSWLRADRVTSLKQAPNVGPRTPMTLTQWLHQSPDLDTKKLRLRATITALGMKALDWSAFHQGLTRVSDGSGVIDMWMPASSVDFYARQFLQIRCKCRNPVATGIGASVDSYG